MLQEDEAVDYGEEEFAAVPVTAAHDEVQLMLDDDVAPADTDTHTTPVEQLASPAAASASASLIDAASETLETTQDAAGPAREKPRASAPIAGGKNESSQRGSRSDERRGASDERARSRRDDGTLPAGWRAIESRSGTHEVYYYNERTGESSWQRPGEPARGAAAVGAKPSASAKKKSKKKNKRAREAAAHAASTRPGASAAVSSQGEAARTDAVSSPPSQGLSIKGAAQRSADPVRAKQGVEQRAVRTETASGDKRKRDAAVRDESRGGGEHRSPVSTPSSGKANGQADKGSDKRPRTTDETRRETRAAERTERTERTDEAARDRRTGDSWRPTNEPAARSGARYAERRREPDAREREARSERARPSVREREYERPQRTNGGPSGARVHEDRTRDRPARTHAQPTEVSSINSTHAHTKRTWGSTPVDSK